MLPYKKVNNRIIQTSFVTCAIALLTSCAVHKSIVNGVDPASFKNNYCNPTIPYQQSAGLWQDKQAIDLTGTHLSKHDQTVCRIIGISSLVDSLWLIKQSKITVDASQSVILRQKITSRILVVQSQLQAVAAELDCEGERSNLAANYLDIINNRKKTNLTVASVTLGALTTVATVLVTNKPTQTGIAIGGGLISAGLAVLTINPKGKTIAFWG